MHNKFRKQLGWNSVGYYETNLIWKEGHSLLNDKIWVRRNIEQLSQEFKTYK